MRRLIPVLVAVSVLALVGCPSPSAPTLTQTVLVAGLDHPWDLGFTPDDTMLFTERSGQLNARLTDGTVMELDFMPGNLAAPSDFLPGGEGGMLGLAVDPDFATNRFAYTCYTSSAPGGTGDVRVVRWVIDAAYTEASNGTPIVAGIPRSSGRHSGCRPRFKPGTTELFIGTGDAATGTNPQNLNSLGGKVLRVNRNGNGLAGNPFFGATPGDDRIFTYGHRNVQGLAFWVNGQLYSVEHGTACDDEINKIDAGVNYGWDPVPGYDESTPMTDLVKFPNARPAAWSSGCPTTAPSGATFLVGSQWKLWNGDLAVAVLKDHRLEIFRLGGAGWSTATSVATRFATGPRLRSAVQGPDGSLYIATDVGPGGEIWRVTPT